MIAAVVGAGHLAAWLGGYMSQRGLSTITVKTNAALCLTLVGVALMLLVLAEAGPARRWAARVCAALSLLLGLLTFVENLSGWDFGIDQLLATEAPGAMAVINPNRMGMPASLSFTLIGLALLILSRRDRRGVRVVQWLALAVCLIALLPTVGFLYGAEEFYGIARYTGIAWPTAVALLLVGVGLLCARPAEGLMAEVTANDPGGVNIRRLLLAFVILPLLLGWLRLVGERAGVFDAPTGTGMMMLLFIIIFSALVYHAGRGASRSAKALRESEARLALAASGTQIGMYEWNIVTGETFWTQQVARLLGLRTTTTTFSQQYHYHDWTERVHPEDLPRVEAELHRCMTERTPFEAEYRIVWPDGSVHWLADRGVPQYESDGRCTRLLGIIMDITERKQAEESLRVSQERLRVALDSAQFGTFDFNPLTGELTWDAQTKQIWGLRPGEELDFTRALERLHAEDRERVRQIVAASLAPNANGDYEAEYRIVWPDGTIHWSSARGRVYFQGQGEQRQAVRMIGVERDITERKRAEEALRETRDYLDNLFNYANAPIIVWDPEFKIIRFNPAFERLTGHKAKEVLGQEIGILFPQDRREESLAHIRRTTSGRQRWEVIEIGILHKDSSVRTVLWNSANVLAPDNQTVIATIAQGQDITERKQAEEALAQARAEAEVRAADLQAILDTGPVAIWIAHDPEARVITGNAYADSIVMNIPRGGNISRSAQPGEAAVFYRVFRKGVELEPEELPAQLAVATGKPVFDQEIELRFDNGRNVQMIASAAPLFDAEGRVRGSVTTAANVTTLKKAEEALRELAATLESKVAQRTAELEKRARQLQKLTLELTQAEDRERRRIAAILHEDLQQQIAGAKYHLGLLSHRTRHDPSVQAIADRIDEMLKDAIEKSRSLSHELSPAVLHLNDLAEAIGWLARRMQAKHGLTVRVDAPDEVTLHSDTLTLFLFRATQEMLFNVVEHARVRDAAIRVRRIRHYLCLSVSDQGRGFDPRELEETSGFGLLSIRERVELLGGRLKIKSAAGRGSSFRIVVPDGPKAKGEGKMAEDVSNLRATSSAVTAPSSGGPLRVLLVDDHEIVRQGLAALLQESPDIIVAGEAADGREAVNMANELRPDVVIMDVAMPLMSGEQATRQIKTLLPETRVIALSMYHEPDKMDTMYKAGADGYVLKTASAEELLAAIRGKKSHS